MGKVETKKEKKRNALYQTAFELFMTQGIAKTSISDIVNKAGVAKGTFYLYFKDKYDIRTKLISHKAQEILRDAHSEMRAHSVEGFVPQIHFLVDYILDYMEKNPALLSFLHKNLSMGVFQNMMEDSQAFDDYLFSESYMQFLQQDNPVTYERPDIMLFTVIELVSSTCYSCIIEKQPVRIDEYRPYLHRTIDSILATFAGKA